MKQTDSMRGNILVVDDTPENLAILTNMLAERGYIVRPAINGEVALRAVDRNPPDLILLDIMMPKMSGFEVCETLKADERTRDIPVIFISALHKVPDKVKAFSLGGVDYIAKPFQLEEVLARVETHMALRRLNRKLQANNVRLEEEVQERVRAEEALKKSLTQIERAKQEWEVTADSLSSVVCLLDQHGRVLRANRTVELWHLAEVGNVKGQSLHDLLHAACAETACYLRTFLAHAWNEVSMGISISCEEYDALLRRHVNIQLRPLLNQPSEPNESTPANFAVAVVADITHQKQAEYALKRHNTVLDILNQMSDRFQECRTEDDTYHVVASTCRLLFPYDAGALYLKKDGMESLQMVTYWGEEPLDSQAFPCSTCLEQIPAGAVTGKRLENQSICRHLSAPPQFGYFCMPIQAVGQNFGVLYLAPGVENAGDIGYADQESQSVIESRQMVISRVTKHYALALLNLRLREKLRIEAIRDPLTGLYNRRYMEESLDRETLRARRRGTPVGILMFDIDHFKKLNDTYGHEAGDKVLQKLGHLFRKYTRSEDVACRYGGEEFLLILPEAPLETVQQRAEELRCLIKEELRVPWQELVLSVTISVGVASFPHHGSVVKSVVASADAALYQAKKQGRDRVVIAPLS